MNKRSGPVAGTRAGAGALAWHKRALTDNLVRSGRRAAVPHTATAGRRAAVQPAS